MKNTVYASIFFWGAAADRVGISGCFVFFGLVTLGSRGDLTVVSATFADVS